MPVHASPWTTGRLTLTRLETFLVGAVAATLLAVVAIVVVTLSGTQASAHTAPVAAVEYTAAEHLADLRAREAAAGDPTLAGDTCEEIVAAVVIPRDWTIGCLDHIGGGQPGVVGQASGDSKIILIERLRAPALLRYTATHEAGHAWALAILDDTAKADLITQVGGDTWAATDLDEGYGTSVSESFANAFAMCRGSGSHADLIPMGCDVMDAALTAAATR